MDWKNGIKGGPFSQKQIHQFFEFLSGLTPGQIQWLSGYFSGIGTLTYEIPGEEVNTHEKKEKLGKSLYILYGTQTGNSENLAREMEKKAREAGLDVTVKNMAVFKPREFKKISNLAVIVSTQGMGEPPIQVEELHKLLHSKKAPDLSGIKFSVLALGDSGYAQFCQTGKEFDNILKKLGGERIYDRVDCDIDYEEDALNWMKSVVDQVNDKKENNKLRVSVNGAPHGKLTAKPQFNRRNPFESTLLEKITVNGKGSTKETLHLEFSLKDSGITYTPGDSLGVYAPNSKRLVKSLLNITCLSGSESIGEKSLEETLTYDYELTPLTAVSLSKYADITGSTLLKKMLEDNLKVREYLNGRDVIDLLKEIPCKMEPSTLLSILRKNSPRMYSIASCQEAFEDEVHLLVSVLRYESYGRLREGKCSTYFADRLNIDQKAKIFVEPNTKFRLPQDEDIPIIMIGPGTGVAPFRAFIQHREMSENPGKSWLFFGERNFVTDFFYQVEWQQYLKEGILTQADVAFSRDTPQKVYVQHKILERGRELFDWMENGAHIYVCGDANRMAKDVQVGLKEVVQVHGDKTREQAEEYVKYLQVSDRYQMDVY